MKRAAIVLLLLAACAREQPSAVSSRASKSSAKTSSAASSQAESTSKAEVGDVMPPYSAARYLDGKPFELSAEKGSVVLLNVWATWCGPCRFEIPELQKLHEKYAARGFKVVGVSVDDSGADAVKQFVAENKITYPIAIDADGSVANVLRTTVIPTSVVIGRDGRIVWRKIGALMPNEVESLDSVVQKALDKR